MSDDSGTKAMVNRYQMPNGETCDRIREMLHAEAVAWMGQLVFPRRGQERGTRWTEAPVSAAELGDLMYLGWCLGNAMKYSDRMSRKRRVREGEIATLIQQTDRWCSDVDTASLVSDEIRRWAREINEGEINSDLSKERWYRRMAAYLRGQGEDPRCDRNIADATVPPLHYHPGPDTPPVWRPAESMRPLVAAEAKLKPKGESKAAAPPEKEIERPARTAFGGRKPEDVLVIAESEEMLSFAVDSDGDPLAAGHVRLGTGETVLRYVTEIGSDYEEITDLVRAANMYGRDAEATSPFPIARLAPQEGEDSPEIKIYSAADGGIVAYDGAAVWIEPVKPAPPTRDVLISATQLFTGIDWADPKARDCEVTVKVKMTLVAREGGSTPWGEEVTRNRVIAHGKAEASIFTVERNGKLEAWRVVYEQRRS